MKQLCGVTWKPLGIISPGADRNVLSSHPFPVTETQAFSKGFPPNAMALSGTPVISQGEGCFRQKKVSQGWVGSAAKVSLLSIVSVLGIPKVGGDCGCHLQRGSSITSAASAMSGNSSSYMGYQLWPQAVPSPGWRDRFILEGFVNMRLPPKLLWDRTRTLLQVRSRSIET